MLSQQVKSRSTAWKVTSLVVSVLAIGTLVSKRVGEADARDFLENGSSAPSQAPTTAPPSSEDVAAEDTEYGLIAQSNWQKVLRVSGIYGELVGFSGLAAQTQENADSAYDTEQLYEIASLAGYILGEKSVENAAVVYGAFLYEAMAVDVPAATYERFVAIITDGPNLLPNDVKGKRFMLAGESGLFLRLTWFATIPTYFVNGDEFTDEQKSRFYEVCGLAEDSCDRVLRALRRDSHLTEHLGVVFEDTTIIDLPDDAADNERANNAAIAYAKRKSFGVIMMEFMFIFVGEGAGEKIAERIGLAAKIAGAEDKKGRERGITVDVLSAFKAVPADVVDTMYTKGQGYTDDEVDAAIASLQDLANVDTMAVFLLPLGGGALSCAERTRFSEYCERVVIGDFEDDDDADAYCDNWLLTFVRTRRVQKVYRDLFREVAE
jgi:hypothetical protein